MRNGFLFLIAILIIILSVFCGSVSATDIQNLTTEQENLSTNYTSNQLTYTSYQASSPSDFIVGYYINTNDANTRINNIDWSYLKSIGVTDIYLRTENSGNYVYVSDLPSIKAKLDSYGLRLNAWVFPGFSQAAEVASYGVGLQVDVETYNIASYIPELTKMRADTYGQIFSICVKPQGWDGEQRYDLLAPICDYIVPMCYTGDYGQNNSDLAFFARTQNSAYPGKFLIALETYKSDQNPVAKSQSEILAEINAVKAYSDGIILFRFSPYLSNFNGGVSTNDITPPSITKSNPVNNTTGVSLTSPITITFSENISSEINYAGIYIKNLNTGKLVSIASKTISGNILTINQTSSRLYNNSYQVYIPAGAIKDINGNILIDPYTFQFTTVTQTDTVPPTVTTSSPANNATGISLTSPITINFSENIAAGTNYSGIYVKNTASGANVSITKTISGNTLTITQTNSRLYNTTYQVYIPAGAIKDSAGNILTTVYSYKFTTIPQTTDTTPPTITKTNPTNNATGFSLTSPITINFSENIKAGPNYTGIYIKNLTTGKIVSIASKTISGNTLTLKMTSSRLSKNTYKVYLPAGAVTDAAGNSLTDYYTFQFKTL
ncbi:MAG: Ig-like domain-containing protein [Methanobacterium sp.]|nr:Ig-like domain-containing protein [Methanobacterium sp.]